MSWAASTPSISVAKVPAGARPLRLKQAQQPVDIAHALADGDAKLGEVGANSADQAAALSNEQVARPVQQDALLHRALDRHEVHTGSVTASQIASASAASFFWLFT
jgi:hypothetical protein